MKKIIYPIAALLLVFMFHACADKGYQQTESGLTYMFHESNRGANPAIDDIVKIDFAYRYPKDSVFFESAVTGEQAYVKIDPSMYPGDIYEALRIMSKGDSATFKFDAQNFFTVTMGAPAVPEFIDPADSLFVDIVLHDMFDEEGYEAYMQAKAEDEMAEREEARTQEGNILDDYLESENIDEEPEESGLIIIVKEEGSGPKPESGQTVKVHYTGMLLDGTVFDSSVERGTPFEFQLGAGRVIRGWDEGIAELNVGSSARLIIPSHLAYGDRTAGEHIEPFSTLIFDIELLDAN